MRTERSQIFRNLPADRSEPIESGFESEYDLKKFLDRTIDLIETLKRAYPDQILSDDVALVSAWQWTDFYVAKTQVSQQTANRAFERWKTRMRGLGLAIEHKGLVEIDDRHVPVFAFDAARAEAEWIKASRAVARLKAARGQPVRELTADEVADELGVTTETVHAWARSGLPSSRIGRRRLFSIDESLAWVREHGTPRARGALARRSLSREDVAAAIASSETIEDAASSLGLSVAQFADLRRELGGAYAPVPLAERTPAWQVVRREEVIDALERHEGRRQPITEDLGLSQHELRRAFAHHDLLEHKYVKHPSHARPLPFTREQLVSAIEAHKGLRSEIAKALGVSREVLRDAILDLGVEDHPMLQFAKIPYRMPRKTGAGRGAPGRPGIRARGSSLESPVERTDTLVPFWLAALREILAKHPGRGASRRASEETGISPPQITNLLKGKRLPGYQYMQAIMHAAGRPEPEWRVGLDELIESHRSDVDRARGHELPLAAASMVAEQLGCSPNTITNIVRRDETPSMEMIRRILEATGRHYMVESIEAPEMIGAGSGRPKTPLAERITSNDIRAAMADTDSWSEAASELGISNSSLVSLVKRFGLEEEFPPQKGRLTASVLERAFRSYGAVRTVADLEAVAKRLRYHPHIVRRKAYDFGFVERGLIPRRMES